MAPFLSCLVCFRQEVVDPAFTFSQFFRLLLMQKFLAGVHISFLQFISQLLNTHAVENLRYCNMV